jgi:3-oxoacyl-[acyl-carrier protein] reductase
VAFTYSSSEKAAKALAKEVCEQGVKAKAYLADSAVPRSLPRLVGRVLSDFGDLDILVNNAGTFLGWGKIGEIKAADYERLMRINLDSVFVLTNAAVKVMKAGARIINISSVLGERAAGPDMGVYNASKFAVTGFSRSWAKDLGPTNTGQRRPARADQHRPEPGDRGKRGRPEIAQIARPIRPAGGSRGGRGFFGRPRCHLHHKGDAQYGRRMHA